MVFKIYLSLKNLLTVGIFNELSCNIHRTIIILWILGNRTDFRSTVVIVVVVVVVVVVDEIIPTLLHKMLLS